MRERAQGTRLGETVGVRMIALCVTSRCDSHRGIECVRVRDKKACGDDTSLTWKAAFIERREARGERREESGERREARERGESRREVSGEATEARGERQEARGERRVVRSERREARGARREARGEW